MDYNQRLYNFIFEQVQGLKYMYNNFNAATFKLMAEKNYHFPVYTMDEWECAFAWAMADVFGGGCEPEIL